MLTQIECPLPAVVTLDELPTNRTIRTVRDSNGAVWVSLSSVAVAAHSYPSRLTTNMRAMRLRPQMVDRQATNPTKRTKLETLTPVDHFYAVAANSTIGGTLYPDIREPILTAIRDGVARLYDWVPESELIPVPFKAGDDLGDWLGRIDATVRAKTSRTEPAANRLLQYETQEEQGKNSTMLDSSMVDGSRFGMVRVRESDIPVALVGASKLLSLRDCAESVGLAMNNQLARLKKMGWANLRSVTHIAADGKKRQMVMIDRETFWGWLITIEAGKIKDESTRETVLWWQKNALRAIDAYFDTFGPVDVARHAVPAASEWADIKGIVVQLTGLVSTVAQMQAATTERLDRMERTLATA